MTPRTWSHSFHARQATHLHLPRLPRLHLSGQRVAALRKGFIVALCALLAGSVSTHLRGALRGPQAPATTAAPARA